MEIRKFRLKKYMTPFSSTRTLKTTHIYYNYYSSDNEVTLVILQVLLNSSFPFLLLYNSLTVL